VALEEKKISWRGIDSWMVSCIKLCVLVVTVVIMFVIVVMFGSCS